MKQPFHPSSRALRTLIAAVIMIIASATTAWAQTGEGGTNEGEIGGGGGGGEIVPVFDAIGTPLTLEPKADGTITITHPRDSMQYSFNGGEKKTMSNTDIPTTITVSAGDVVRFYGYKTTIQSYFNSFNDYTHIDCTANCNIYGNIMSLVDETGFANNTKLTAEYTFIYLFERNTHLINHPEKSLVLPATTLQAYCYYGMFYGCSGLTTAPSLPAKTLAERCYDSMFRGCTRLTTAPVLPATTLAEGCYAYMFYGCTSLTTAPVLPATTLAEGCYAYMFYGCTSLTTAPDLSAAKLVEDCYENMFRDCSSLNYVKCLATDISATYYTKNWLKDVAPSGTFVRATNTDWGEPSPSGIPSAWKVEEDITGTPLTLETTAACTITITNPQNDMQYSINGRSKTKMTGTTTIEVSRGKTVQFYGNRSCNGTNISCSANCYIYGNIMSLVDETGYTTNTTLSRSNAFNGLFKGNTHLINHPEKSLVLPAKTLTLSCYNSMFEGCIGLTTAPALPAKKLEVNCYYGMFAGCSGLTTAPDLPATTLATRCYCEMFKGCTSLTTAPELPVTTLKEKCYWSMFEGCSGLTTAPDLPATTLKDYCYQSMFSGCTSLTMAPSLPATSLATGCYVAMFYGCTGLTTAPELPVKTLKESCYYGMFKGCTSLTTAPALPAKTLAEECYEDMFRGCTNLSYVECLATNISATDCTDNWLKDVASSGTFIKAANTNWSRNSSGIPNGWTVRQSGGLTLYDNGDNSATVEGKHEQEVSYVVLADRTLYRDGTWNTLCLPFDVSDGDDTDGITFTGTPLAGATVKTLTAASFSNGILTLTFGPDVTTIEAGKPYVVKWETDTEGTEGTENTKLNSPVFDNVTIDKKIHDVTFSGVVNFRGTYSATTYDAEKRSILFLDADRSPQAGSTTTLQYATSGTRLGAFRAYFDVDLDGQAGTPFTDCVLDFGNNDTQTCPFVDRGDANGDGTISVTDIAVVVNCILRLPTTGGYSPGGADANSDGDITVTDIGVIVDKILGLPPTPPQGRGEDTSPQ